MIDLEALVAQADSGELPRLIGELARAQAVAVARLQAPSAQAGPEPLLDSAAAAAFLNVSPYYVEQLARERRIPCVRPPGTGRAGRQREGRLVRFRRTDLAAWAANHLDSGWSKTTNGR
jgi:hypothetical protein